MMMVRGTVGMILAGGLVLLCGCPLEDYSHVGPADLVAVNKIVNNEDLPNEKRMALAELGFSPSTINVLLRTITFANQFGGDQRTAYDKVVGGQFDEMTPDEIQIFAGDASNIDDDDDVSVSLSDAEAQAIADFFDDYGIASKEELEAFLDTPGAVVPDTIPDGAVQTLFVDFDATLLLPILP